MAGGAKKGKSSAAKKFSPGSQARVERKKKIAGKKPGRAASQPKQGKGTVGTGGEGGGLH